MDSPDLTETQKAIVSLKNLLTKCVGDSTYEALKSICRRYNFPQGSPRESRTDFIDRFLTGWQGRRPVEVSGAHKEIALDSRFTAISELFLCIHKQIDQGVDPSDYAQVVHYAFQKLSPPHSARYFSDLLTESERFKKIAKFSQIAEATESPSSSTLRPAEEASAFTKDTIEFAGTVLEFDGRTGIMLYTAELLGHIRLNALDIPSAGIRKPMALLKTVIEDFFQNVKSIILQNEDANTNDIKAAIVQMIETSRTRRKAIKIIDDLNMYLEDYGKTTMYRFDRERLDKDDQVSTDIMTAILSLPNHIKIVQNELRETAKADCEISAGAIGFHLGQLQSLSANALASQIKFIPTCLRSELVLQSLRSPG